jgi:peptidoglycan/xylan/chitin deacetylase (PgdA/CDA1 family)
LFNYGSGCDALRRPVGDDTSHVPRPHHGKIPYGPPISECVVPKTVALTYDDGPNVYTKDLLDILDAFKAKATFFLTGINSGKGPIDDPRYPWLKLIQRMYDSGHQIASHTWSHQNLDKISPPQRHDQIVKNEMAIRNILGGFPTYMRPPYSGCSNHSGCLGDMSDLGYHVTLFDVDTDDYNSDTPERIQRSKDLFDKAMAKRGSTGRPLLAICHDVHSQTVYNLTAHILRRISDAGYRAVTVGECLKDPPLNWYRSDGQSTSLGH